MTDLAVGEAMKMTAQIDMFNMKYFIPEASSRGGFHDILVERKWDEEDDDKEIDNCTNSPHAFRSVIDFISIFLSYMGSLDIHFYLLDLGHVFAFQTCFHEHRSKPSYHAIRSCKG